LNEALLERHDALLDGGDQLLLIFANRRLREPKTDEDRKNVCDERDAWTEMAT
jgi:hypothetical protein